MHWTNKRSRKKKKTDCDDVQKENEEKDKKTEEIIIIIVVIPRSWRWGEQDRKNKLLTEKRGNKKEKNQQEWEM